MSKGPEYALATELVNKLRYFDGDCALCELCNHRHNCDSDGLFGCKTGIAEWIFKVLRNAEKKEPTEEQIRKKAYYQAHKAEYTAKAKARYKNSKEKHNEQNRQYYLRHKEEVNERNKQRQEAHAEQIKEYNKQWHDEHPGYRGNKTAEEIQEYNRQYYQAHKDEYKQRAMERKERLRAEILASED